MCLVQGTAQIGQSHSDVVPHAIRFATPLMNLVPIESDILVDVEQLQEPC